MSNVKIFHCTQIGQSAYRRTSFNCVVSHLSLFSYTENLIFASAQIAHRGVLLIEKVCESKVCESKVCESKVLRTLEKLAFRNYYILVIKVVGYPVFMRSKNLEIHADRLFVFLKPVLWYTEYANIFVIDNFLFSPQMWDSLHAIFENNCTPSGKKKLTGVHVVTVSQVQTICCRWQAISSCQ